MLIFKPLDGFHNKSVLWASYKIKKLNFIKIKIFKHACIRTAMNFGINKIHVIQRYNSVLLNVNKFRNEELLENDRKLANNFRRLSSTISNSSEKKENEFDINSKASSGTSKWMDIIW